MPFVSWSSRTYAGSTGPKTKFSAVRAMAPRPAVELGLGHDGDLVGQLGAECAEADGLVRSRGSRSARPARRRRRSALGWPAARHRARRGVAHDLAVWASEMRLVSGPPSLVKTVISIGQENLMPRPLPLAPPCCRSLPQCRQPVAAWLGLLLLRLKTFLLLDLEPPCVVPASALLAFLASSSVTTPAGLPSRSIRAAPACLGPKVTVVDDVCPDRAVKQLSLDRLAEDRLEFVVDADLERPRRT